MAGRRLTCIISALMLVLCLQCFTGCKINDDGVIEGVNTPRPSQSSETPAPTMPDVPDENNTPSSDIGMATSNTTESTGVDPTPNSDIFSRSEIIFKDPYLEDVIRELLNRPIGKIYTDDVSNITSFTARVRGIRKIDDLAYFSSLEELDLFGNKITDLSPLSNLTKLKKINISSNYAAISDISGGNGLNLKPLSKLVLLEEFYCESNSVTELRFLSGLTKLRVLDLYDNKITSVEPLFSLVNLEGLYLGKNMITDASTLAYCKSLKVLSLESNTYYSENGGNDDGYIGLSDISFVWRLQKLQRLNISYNLIKNIDGVAQLPDIISINASNNYITDISLLDGCQVSTLNLEYNMITDFKGVENMENLSYLGYQGNPIENVKYLNYYLRKIGELPPLSEEEEDEEEAKEAEEEVIDF